jgi:hypothetical protein
LQAEAKDFFSIQKICGSFFKTRAEWLSGNNVAGGKKNHHKGHRPARGRRGSTKIFLCVSLCALATPLRVVNTFHHKDHKDHKGYSL